MILSDIEQRIKAKIEAIGTPLKDWDIQINYGIKTGFNDAFIIDGEKRAELIAQDPKSEEIIRPILRGRDIKRYGYEWNDKYVIIARLESDIPNKYPAICKHLEQFKGKGKLGDNSTTKVFKRPWWAWMQEPVSYWEDFYRQKIVYPETTQGAYFALDKNNIMLDKTCFMIVSSSENLEYLMILLSSKLYEFAYKSIFSSIELGISGYQYNKHALIQLPIVKVSKETEKEILFLFNNKEFQKLDMVIYKLYNLQEKEIAFIKNI